MSVNLSPLAGAAWQFFDTNGKPLNGGLLNTYTAGTTTPQPTFTTSSGSVQNTNPIVLGADGRTPQEIWLTAGVAYKFVLTDSLSNLIGTYDNIIGVNDVSFTLNQWVATNLTPTFVSATQFTVPGDQTLILTVGRRLQVVETAGTVVCVVTAVAFTTLTTVTVQFETTNTLDSGLSVVSYSLLTSVADALPRGVSSGPEISVASATTTPIGASGSENVLITGTTTITAFDTVNAGIIRYVRFNGALTLTNNVTSLILPNLANITTVANDTAIFRSEGGGNWRCIAYAGKGVWCNTITIASSAGNIPATSINFGGTSLSVYNEGTWTPTFVGSSTAGSNSYNSQIGRYTRIGRLVNLEGEIDMSIKDGAMAGNVLLGGLPFTAATVASNIGSIGVSAFTSCTLDAGYTCFGCIVINNTVTAAFLENGSNKTASQIPQTDLGSAAKVSFGGSYSV